MRRWELPPEPRLHNARHMPDGPSCKQCSCRLQTHTRALRARGGGAPTHRTAHDKWQEDQTTRTRWETTQPAKKKHQLFWLQLNKTHESRLTSVAAWFRETFLFKNQFLEPSRTPWRPLFLFFLSLNFFDFLLFFMFLIFLIFWFFHLFLKTHILFFPFFGKKRKTIKWKETQTKWRASFCNFFHFSNILSFVIFLNFSLPPKNWLFSKPFF